MFFFKFTQSTAKMSKCCEYSSELVVHRVLYSPYKFSIPCLKSLLNQRRQMRLIWAKEKKKLGLIYNICLRTKRGLKIA